MPALNNVLVPLMNMWSQMASDTYRSAAVYLGMQLVREETNEPLQGHQRRVHMQTLQVARERFQFGLDEASKHLLVNEHSQHRRVRVKGQDGFDETAKCPEGLFLVHVAQQMGHNEIQSLAVPDFGVAFREAAEHIAQSFLLLFQLRILRLRKCPRQVLDDRPKPYELDLLKGGIGIAADAIVQSFVIVRVRQKGRLPS